MKIAVIGLGYVGLPLAISLAVHFDVVGFDISEARITGLNSGVDANKDVDDVMLQSCSCEFSSCEQSIIGRDVFIVCVPTPIFADNSPDLSLLENACRLVGKSIRKGAVVVFESTVFPGCTRNFCVPLLERWSYLNSSEDFMFGYSPERVSPGFSGKELSSITKLISGNSQRCVDILLKVYGAIISAELFVVDKIEEAEAAKVIENVQRDVNIALVNEFVQIFDRMNINSSNVLNAARTKWNFLDFKPGFVGGHCIGIDPYYLSHAAIKAGFHPRLTLAGRSVNEGMVKFVLDKFLYLLAWKSKSPVTSKVIVMGCSFKENISDVRNSKTFDLISALEKWGVSVAVVDPVIDREAVRRDRNIVVSPSLFGLDKADAIIITVSHSSFDCIQAVEYRNVLTKDGFIIDVKCLLSTPVKADLEGIDIVQF